MRHGRKHLMAAAPRWGAAVFFVDAALHGRVCEKLPGRMRVPRVQFGVPPNSCS